MKTWASFSSWTKQPLLKAFTHNFWKTNNVLKSTVSRMKILYSIMWNTVKNSSSNRQDSPRKFFWQSLERELSLNCLLKLQRCNCSKITFASKHIILVQSIKTIFACVTRSCATLNIRFARTLSISFITSRNAIQCPCGVAITRWTPKGICNLQCVEQIFTAITICTVDIFFARAASLEWELWRQ